MFPYFSLFGKTFGTYGLLMVVGFALGSFLAYRRGKKFSLAVENLLIIVALALLGAIFLGGLLYVFVTYPLEMIWDFISRGDFSFLSSGIVFYGGLIGGIIGAWAGSKLAGVRFSQTVYVFIPFVPLGHAVGRIGCVMAGCCHGFEYDGPFALYYPSSVTGLDPNKGYFPSQLVEAAINIGICLFLLWLSKKGMRSKGLLLSYICLYAVQRFALEFLRGDSIRGLYFGLSTSQWISLALLVFAGVYFLFSRNRQAADTQ